MYTHIHIYIYIYMSRARMSTLFCAVFARIRRLRESLQYSLAILLGRMTVSAKTNNTQTNDPG